MNRVAWWTCALLALLAGSQARIYRRCELARDLRALGVHPDHISTWVCIAYHESRFDTAANNPHSGDHGIFQISELYWCGAGKACGLPCSSLRDDDISDDLECALQVHEEHTRLQGDGFLAWVVYPQHCRQSTKKYLIDCDENLKNASASSEGRAFNSFSPFSYEDRYKPKPADRTYISNSNIDSLLPPYLAISSIFRGSYGKVLDHNRINGVDWYNYKYDKVDELKIPDFGPGQSPTTSTTTTTTTTTTTYVPPVKPWRFIETNQFRKKIVSPEKTDSEKNALDFSTSKPLTEANTDESLTSVTAANDILSEVKSHVDSNKSQTTLTSTIKPASIINTAYKLPAYTASYKSQTTTSRPSPVTYGSSAGSKNNYVTSTPGNVFPSSTTKARPTFSSFAFTFPTTTTTVKPKTAASTAFTFPPWAFSSRTRNTASTTTQKPTTTDKPTTSRSRTSWYTVASRIKPFETSTTTSASQNTSKYQPINKSFFTSSTQNTLTPTTTTQKPTLFTKDTTQNPLRKQSTTQKPLFTWSSTKPPRLFTSPTTQKSSLFSWQTTRKPTTFTSSSTRTPTTTTQKSLSTTKTTQKSTTQQTTRITQNIFDLYLNPTKAPQLPSYSFLRDNSKFKFNIFSGGTTTISPPAKTTNNTNRKKETPV